MASGKIINLNDAILEINSDCSFQNSEPYTDYSKIIWGEGSPIVSQEDAEAKMVEMQTAEDAKSSPEDLKASAKAKLISGDPLTAEEADTIVL
tara:strand:+ start:80 stop:358 length:279 start_codon:yes stop_codon:yes gene_type:complete